MAERRHSRRSKSFLRGFVYVSRKRGALACLIRDLSGAGARIVFSDQVMLPSEVDLYIPQRDQVLRAHVQWRKNDEIGLAFVESETSAGEPTAADVIERMAMLEAEITSLRTLLKRLKNEKTRQAGDAAA
jgi:hypothetical protein